MSDPRLESALHDVTRAVAIDQLAEAITRDALMNYAHGMDFTAAVKGAAVYHLGESGGN